MKEYLSQSVYEAALSRLEYVFYEFDQVLVAFSGGKDSGVLLNLAYDYAEETNQKEKLIMYHLDYEAQYQMTTDYVTETFEKFDDIQRYWLCLPIRAQSAVSSFEYGWIPFDPEKRELWVRGIPQSDYVVTECNVPFPFKKGEWDYTVQGNFTEWVSKDKKTATLIGIRADESLNRFRAIKSNKKVNQYDQKNWITQENNIFKVYPIYDWEVEDIWVYNAKFNKPYNKLYDLYYQSGLSLDKMRVASPFNDAAIGTLNLYQAIDPDNWAKMVGRIKGVNFAGLYGGTTAMGWKNIELPKGHTWKSYLEFLLSTLPDEVSENYRTKFQTSIEFWRKRGGVLDEKTIKELKEIGVNFEVGEKTNYKTDKLPVRFEEYPDDADVTDFKSVPSYKRMAICVMKNDHLCKYMGFSATKEESKRRREAIEKYKNIL